MGTPLRLLSPKLLSPKSPVGFGKFLEAKSNESFSNASKKHLTVTSPILFSPNEKNLFGRDVQIKINRFSFSDKDKPVMIKTPEKFEILENGLRESDLNVLGRGSFGTVVTGVYKNEEVAVKVVKLRENEKLNETKALGLNHKNIVKTLDVIINSNMNYAIIVMERLDQSRHLQNIVDDENYPLNETLVLKYALDVSRGLDFCHRNGLVHMDLKPGNILVGEDAVCKLCDFGSCYDIEMGSGEDYVHRGTIAYTAPEILLGRKPNKKCDIYSLGITLWQMVTRKVPYEDVRHYEVIVYKYTSAMVQTYQLSLPSWKTRLNHKELSFSLSPIRAHDELYGPALRGLPIFQSNGYRIDDNVTFASPGYYTDFHKNRNTWKLSINFNEIIRKCIF